MYTLARDQCAKGYPIGKPRFEIVGDFKRWRPEIATSMIKVLHIRFFDGRDLVSIFLIMTITISWENKAF